MNTNAFAKGDALAKLIELIGADNKAFKAQDAELLSAINEVREMFNSDELTVCSWDELVGLASAGQLEPGHAYKINHIVYDGGKSLVDLVVQAKSNTELKTIAIADNYLVHMQNGEDLSIFKYPIEVVDGRVPDGANVEGDALPTDIFPDGTYLCTTSNPSADRNGAIISIDKKHVGYFGIRWYYGYIVQYEVDDVKEFGVHDAIHFDDLVKLITEGSKDPFTGATTATSLLNLPVTKSTVNVEVSADGTLSWATGLEAGQEVLAVIHNTGAADINIILPDNSNEDVLTIPAGEYSEVSVVNVNGTYYTRVPSTTGAVVDDNFIGSNEVTTLVGLPVDKSTINAEITTDETLSWSEGLASGREVLCIIHNTGSDTITIGLPENCNTDSIKVGAGEYIEAAVVAIDGTYYTRVSVEEVASGSGSSTEYEEITAADVQAMFNGTYGA